MTFIWGQKVQVYSLDIDSSYKVLCTTIQWLYGFSEVLCVHRHIRHKAPLTHMFSTLFYFLCASNTGSSTQWHPRVTCTHHYRNRQSEALVVGWVHDLPRVKCQVCLIAWEDTNFLWGLALHNPHSWRFCLWSSATHFLDPELKLCSNITLSYFPLDFSKFFLFCLFILFIDF